MFTLIKQENYKLLKGKTLPITGGLLIIFQLLMMFMTKKYNFVPVNTYFSSLGTSPEIIEVMMVVIASTIITNEFVKGTIKNLLDRQYSRGQVFLSKLFTLIEVYIYLMVINGIMIGIAKLTVFHDVQITNAIKNNIEHGIYGNILYLLLLISIIILISNIAKSAGGAIGIGVAFIFASQIISQLMTILIKKVPMLKWNPFNFFQIETQLNIGGAVRGLTQLSNNQMILGTIIYALIFYGLAYLVFKKRNI